MPEVPEGEQLPEVMITGENLEKANLALKLTSTLGVNLLERVKLERRLVEAATASPHGWGIVPHLEQTKDVFQENEEEWDLRLKQANAAFKSEAAHKTVSARGGRGRNSRGGSRAGKRRGGGHILGAMMSQLRGGLLSDGLVRGGYSRGRGFNRGQFGPRGGGQSAAVGKTCFKCKSPG